MTALCRLGSSAAPQGRMPSSRPGALTRLGTLGLVAGPGPLLIASLGSAVLMHVGLGGKPLVGLPRVRRG